MSLLGDKQQLLYSENEDISWNSIAYIFFFKETNRPTKERKMGLYQGGRYCAGMYCTSLYTDIEMPMFVLV